MIKSVKLNNFQSHKESTLEFDKGMNVIVGASDSGKTAIIRALRLAIYNKPGGDEYRSTWGGDTYVEVNSRNNTVTRSRGKKGNVYKLNDTEFKAFGQNVPDEITQALNMDNINLQQQMDSPFLLSETSGNVALHFNKLAKLDKIDNGLKYVQQHLNSINSDIKYSKNEIESKKEQLTEFIDLESLESHLIIIENLEIKQKDFLEKDANLTRIQLSVERLQLKIKEKSKILKQEKSIDEILKLYKDKSDIETNHTLIKRLSLKLYYLQQDIKKSGKTVLAEKDINKLLLNYQNIAKSKRSLSQLSKLYISMEKSKMKQENALKSLSKLEVQYKRDFPSICPLCDTKIK